MGLCCSFTGLDWRIESIERAAGGELGLDRA